MSKYHLETVGYSGHVFSDFEPRRDHSGPGWFVFGRNAEKYGTLPDGKGAYVKLCAWRFVRRHPHYNCPVRHGWKTKREAQAIADKLNSAYHAA